MSPTYMLTAAIFYSRHSRVCSAWAFKSFVAGFAIVFGFFLLLLVFLCFAQY